jgi:hypothetical protein
MHIRFTETSSLTLAPVHQATRHHTPQNNNIKKADFFLHEHISITCTLTALNSNFIEHLALDHTWTGSAGYKSTQAATGKATYT